MGKTQYDYKMIYLSEQEHEEEFYKHYKREMNVTYDYQKTAKELREDHYGEKVYKYYPKDIPFKIENNVVYSFCKENNWAAIGKLTDDEIEKINSNTSWLRLFSGEYKEVWDEIEKEADDPFFGFLVKVKM